MKYTLTFIVLYFFLPIGIKAQKTNGYFVNVFNDTMLVQIKVPKLIFGGIDMEGLFSQVNIVDSAGEVTNYKPGEIVAFSFNYKENNYHLVSKPRRKYDFWYRATMDTVICFMEEMNKGARANFYRSFLTISGGKVNSVQEFYTFERSEDNTHLYLSNYSPLNEISTGLAAFYHNVPSIATILQRRFEQRKDIQKDIQSVMNRINGY